MNSRLLGHADGSGHRRSRPLVLSSLLGAVAAATVAVLAACSSADAPASVQSGALSTAPTADGIVLGGCGAWENHNAGQPGHIVPLCSACGAAGEAPCVVSQTTPAQCRNGEPLPAGATLCSAPSCAEVGDACCSYGFTNYCVGGLTCNSGTCAQPTTACGASGGQCCWSAATDTYSTCGAGLGCKQLGILDVPPQSVSGEPYQCQGCGAYDEVPCATSTNEGCNAGLAPLNLFGSVACITCGGVNDIPCVSGSACTSGASVSSSNGFCECVASYNASGASCVHCGNAGEAACTTGNACTGNASASGGTCACNGGYVAQNGACVACGGKSGEPVCAGNTCGAGLSDQGGICCPSGDVNSGGSCVQCGGHNGGNQPACPTGAACNSGYVDANGTCEPCGTLGHPACAGGVCGGGSVNNGGSCTCAKVGQKGTCCAGLQENQNDGDICATADPAGCGVTTIGDAPPCCKNSKPCQGDGICETDNSVSPPYQYCCSPSAETCSSN